MLIMHPKLYSAGASDNTKNNKQYSIRINMKLTHEEQSVFSRAQRKAYQCGRMTEAQARTQIPE